MVSLYRDPNGEKIFGIRETSNNNGLALPFGHALTTARNHDSGIGASNNPSGTTKLESRVADLEDEHAENQVCSIS